MLRIPPGWTPESMGLDAHRMCRTQMAARRFWNHEFNVRMGKNVRRVYHVLCIGGSRELRRVVRLKADMARPLAIVDIKSAFPYLLTEMMVPKEAESLREMLDGDIYSLLAPDVPRPEAKVQFMIMLSGLVDSRRYPLHAEFKRLFPRTFFSIAEMRNQGHSLSRTLQTREANHVVHTVVKNFTSFCVPIHDAILCRLSDSEKISDLLSDGGRFKTTLTKIQ